MKRWPVVVAIVMLVGTFGLLQELSHGESAPTKRPFAGFPLTIEGWQGKEVGLQRDVLKLLQLSDYMMRVYLPQKRDGTLAPVWLYTGYYASQRTGTTYHSPKNCLPGAGWQFAESDFVTVLMPDKTSITINKVLIKKGLDQQVLLYWYHDRGRVIASEYWAKAYLVWDAMTRHRTDGALVRLSVPVTTTAEEAYLHGLNFLHDLWPLLQDYMPTGKELT
jgi:EpsI family protein